MERYNMTGSKSATLMETPKISTDTSHHKR